MDKDFYDSQYAKVHGSKKQTSIKMFAKKISHIHAHLLFYQINAIRTTNVKHYFNTFFYFIQSNKTCIHLLGEGSDI